MESFQGHLIPKRLARLGSLDCSTSSSGRIDELSDLGKRTLFCPLAEFQSLSYSFLSFGGAALGEACKKKKKKSFGGRASPFSHPWFLTEFSNPGIEFYGFSILCGPRGGVAGRVVR